MNVTRPETLVQRTVQVLREQLAEGRFGEVLPGEPRLAARLLVSRGTLRKTLEILAAEGAISGSLPGKPRRVIALPGVTPQQRTHSVGVLIPRPLDALSTATQHFLRDLAAATASEGIVFAYYDSSATRLKHPARRLRALLAENHADLWLLYEATIPVVRFFRTSGTQAIVSGGPAVDEGVSFCGFDGLAALRHAIGVFTRAGHTRIVHATRYHRPLREQTFREEFEKRNLPFRKSSLMPCWNNDFDQLRRLLHSRLTGPARPTAWILNGLDALVVLFSTLLELGLTVPKDLSILTFGSDPMFDCFRPVIGHYTTPHRALALAMARTIRARLHSPNSAPIVKLLQTEYIRGESVGPGPNQHS